jgi:uncharacterized protein (TIGR02596 family)
MTPPSAFAPRSRRFFRDPLPRPACGQAQRRGFTLIEMLVVVAVIALVTSAVAPMVFSSLMATRITSAGETMASQIALGHQLAVSGNQEVEVRFYQYAEASEPGSVSSFRALALMKTASEVGGLLGQQLTDTFYLPSGIVVGNGAILSPPLQVLPFGPDKEGIIKKVQGATYRAFHFYPDGTTDLPQYNLKANRCYLTVGEERILANGTVPPNFYAIQIDPNTGRTVTYRP